MDLNLIINIGLLITAILTVLITIVFYVKQKNKEMRRAINEIYMLIESTQIKIDKIVNCVNLNGNFNYEELWLTDNFYGLNRWEELK